MIRHTPGTLVVPLCSPTEELVSVRHLSGLSESNRHLNLGKVDRKRQNAGLAAFLTICGSLDWKIMENGKRAGLYIT
jgi:hypothetical protein